MHWAKRNQYNKGWHYEIMLSKNKAKIVGRPKLSGVTITIEQFFYGRKPMDRDNLYGSNKPLIDALTTNGIIEDDNPECVKRLYCQQQLVAKCRWGTSITIQSDQGERRPAETGAD